MKERLESVIIRHEMPSGNAMNPRQDPQPWQCFLAAKRFPHPAPTSLGSWYLGIIVTWRSRVVTVGRRDFLISLPDSTQIGAVFGRLMAQNIPERWETQLGISSDSNGILGTDSFMFKCLWYTLYNKDLNNGYINSVLLHGATRVSKHSSAPVRPWPCDRSH